MTYMCFDCGSTVEGHHTLQCELAEEGAIRDLPSKPHTQHWTGAKVRPIPSKQIRK